MEPLQPTDPRRVGDYELLARLGAGGMGVVYLGRSPGGRAVAVKVVHQRFGRDSHYRARFRREVASARLVTNAYTAPLLAADPEAAAPWLVMGYLPGLTLRQAVDRYGELPPSALHLLAVALAEALADIHRAGLVHRDLKPSNIMLTANGPRVIDFGIARPEDATGITATGSVLGTVGFMSPEQARGGETQAPGDVFALGAVLAFAALGEEPFGIDDRAITLERIQRGQVDLHRIADRKLRAAIASCLHPSPGHRPTAADLLDRLGRPKSTVQGTRWLPAPLALDIDARGMPIEPAPGRAAPPPPGAGSEDLAGATTYVSRVNLPVTPVPLSVPPRPGRRTLLLSLAAGTVVVGAAVPLVLRARAEAGESSPPAAQRPGTRLRSTAPRVPAVVRRWRTPVSTTSLRLYRAGAMVIAADGRDRVTAIDPRTGRIRWQRVSEQRAMNESVAVGPDAVYLFDLLGARPATTIEPYALRAVHPLSQRVRWTRRVPATTRGTAASGPLVCVAVDDEVRALAAADGRRRWTARANGAALAVGAGLVVAVDGPVLVGLDAASGRTRWRRELAEVANYCLISDDLVVTRDALGAVYALRGHDGRTAWRRSVDYRSSVRHTTGGLVYVGEVDGRVRALCARTGKQMWERRLAAEGRFAESDTLCLAGDTLWVQGPQQAVYALDATDGRVLATHGAWTAPESQSSTGSQAVAAGGLVLLATSDGYVEAVEPPR
ncbi:PQQ-binding-like beta-propeller repeat protein [Streptomyces sp. HSW2009]|uniref:serine/threonine-protein kinase n=1 Tax=Streptomyces sp. HSW2009 TaxID=3142890 RepID=UPI0032ECE4A3